MSTASKPWWQQATALVTVSASGVITGFNFAPAAAAETTPTSVPLHLLALQQAAQPDTAGKAPASDAQLRAAIVNVAAYYLKLAKTKTPAQVEALIWGAVSSDGTDHGPSCAAFASLTLELAAQTTGLRSWVTGGTTYPWPLPAWADVRVETNPASPQVTSVVADAQAHGRWHPLSDDYTPQPGDWAVYDGHVEVVTSYSGGVLDTIGADSLPGLTLNAHSSAAPLAEQGIVGFVDNGHLQSASGSTAPANTKAAPAKAKLAAAAARGSPACPAASHSRGQAAFPAPDPARGKRARESRRRGQYPASSPPASCSASLPRVQSPRRPKPFRPSTTPPAASPSGSSASSSPREHATAGTRNQQAFITLIAPGAVAAKQRYGVPASVTIAQAIEESAWGQSSLAARYHNLFGIKGTGPAGSVTLPTQEYESGSWVTIDAQFAVYRNDAESIAGHAELLATSGYYIRAMADRAHPDAFANDLTGVYATDPGYGTNLIALMKLYNLYQYDTAPAAAPAATYSKHATPSLHGQRRHGTLPCAVSGRAPVVAARYQAQLPQAVRTALFTTAKGPLDRSEQLYRDVAATTGGSWKLLAAADWMQCRANPRYSPVQGEKLGTVNSDGTSYTTRTAALVQCACRPHRTGFRGVRHRPHRPPPAVRPGDRGRVRRVPLGCPPQAARRVPGGVPLLGGRPHRRAPEDALAAHRRPRRARPARNPLPPAVRRGPRGPQPRLPSHRLTSPTY